MNAAGAISRNGTTVLWSPMSGGAGVYDPTSGTVVGPPEAAAKKIKAVLDGYGSIASQLRADHFSTNSVEVAGGLWVYTTAAIQTGDKLEINSQVYTVKFSKAIYSKEKILVYVAQVEL